MYGDPEPRIIPTYHFYHLICGETTDTTTNTTVGTTSIPTTATATNAIVVAPTTTTTGITSTTVTTTATGASTISSTPGTAATNITPIANAAATTATTAAATITTTTTISPGGAFLFQSHSWIGNVFCSETKGQPRKEEPVGTEEFQFHEKKILVNTVVEVKMYLPLGFIFNNYLAKELAPIPLWTFKVNDFKFKVPLVGYVSRFRNGITLQPGRKLIAQMNNQPNDQAVERLAYHLATGCKTILLALFVTLKLLKVPNHGIRYILRTFSSHYNLETPPYLLRWFKCVGSVSLPPLTVKFKPCSDPIQFLLRYSHENLNGVFLTRKWWHGSFFFWHV
eukprot:TRINITY_DN593_c0_g1_i2.p1 TRINITY_DN593_c0_g1~~TRINITY_DN593_c0_g1_i2.p1  ORF type:complete len:337 (+),score=80.05 TRINITY_DN593_c0_g1_i2:977-1987(+)